MQDKSMKQMDNLSIYFTAGYPELNSTIRIIQHLDDQGVSYIEIGVPFSDPLADGPVIQESAKRAIENGMTLSLLLEQLESLDDTDCGLILMGYYNVFLQYGVDNLLKKAVELNIKGIIIPDCPPKEFELYWKEKFETSGIGMIFLITPSCSVERIKYLSKLSFPFIYAVSDFSITGAKGGFSEEQLLYFKRLSKIDFQKPVYLGFGISDHETYAIANQYFEGAIIGSAFIKVLSEGNGLTLEEKIIGFVDDIRKK